MDNMERLPLTRTQVVVLAVALLVALGLVGKRIAAEDARQPEARPLTRVKAPPAQRGRIAFVHVAGAVRHPGLYRLREGSRVAEALSRAGGPSAKADLAAVNLAAPVVDGTQVFVPAAGAPGAAGRNGSTSGTPSTISLASATEEQLDGLPGIGPVTAARIVAWRQEHGPFRSVEELDDVPGIGPARVEQLRELVTP